MQIKEERIPSPHLRSHGLKTQKACCGLQANFPDRGKCFRSVWGLNVSGEIGHAVSVPHGGGGGEYRPAGARYKTYSYTRPRSANLYLAATALGEKECLINWDIGNIAGYCSLNWSTNHPPVRDPSHETKNKWPILVTAQVLLRSTGLSVPHRKHIYLRYRPHSLMTSVSLWWWYININITILYIIHCPVLYLKLNSTL
jgi:hypothetical protein